MQADRPQDPLPELNRQLCEAARHEPIVHHIWDRFGGWNEVSLHVLVLILLRRQEHTVRNTYKIMSALRQNSQLVEIPKHPEAMISYEELTTKLDREIGSAMGLPPDSLH